MGLIRELKNIDFTVNSKPWTEEELRDFRKIMTNLKAKSAKSRSEKTQKPPHRLKQTCIFEVLSQYEPATFDRTLS